MLQLFWALKKVSGNGGGLGGDFLSNHPLTSDRIKWTKRIALLKRSRRFPPLTRLNYSTLHR